MWSKKGWNEVFLSTTAKIDGGARRRHEKERPPNLKKPKSSALTLIYPTRKSRDQRCLRWMISPPTVSKSVIIMIDYISRRYVDVKNMFVFKNRVRETVFIRHAKLVFFQDTALSRVYHIPTYLLPTHLPTYYLPITFFACINTKIGHAQLLEFLIFFLDSKNYQSQIR